MSSGPGFIAEELVTYYSAPLPASAWQEAGAHFLLLEREQAVEMG